MEIWAQDEARLGLQPTLRRTWAIKGKRPIAFQCPRFQWTYLYNFVHPLSGKTFWLILPTVNTLVMNLALDEFIKFVDPDKKKLLVLLLDNAGWHVCKDLKVSENVKLFPLPSYTPQLQPVECNWPLIRQVTANRTFEDLDELENILVERCRYLMDHPEIIKGQCGFQWIIDAEMGNEYDRSN